MTISLIVDILIFIGTVVNVVGMVTGSVPAGLMFIVALTSFLYLLIESRHKDGKLLAIGYINIVIAAITLMYAVISMAIVHCLSKLM